MALAQQGLDLALHVVQVLGVGHGQRDLHHRAGRQAHAAEQATAPGFQRHHHHVVLVLAEPALPLGLERADHGERHPPEADVLADAGIVAEQGAAHRVAQDHHLAGAAIGLRIEGVAFGDLPAVDVEELRLHALPAGRCVVLGEHHLGVAAQRARHVLHVLHFVADRLGVVFGEGEETARAHSRAATGAATAARRNIQPLRT